VASNFFIKLAALTLAFISCTAQCCTVNNAATANVRAVVKQNGGWPVSDNQCALLNKYKLGLNVTAKAAVLSGVNVGWAAVSLISETNIISDEVGISTTVNTSMASQPTADKVMYEAISDAIDKLNWQAAAVQVDKYRVLSKK